MVALASAAVPRATRRTRELAWTLGAAAVVLVGASLRLAIGGGGVGDLSATVMAVLLTAGAWAAARLLGGARLALFVVVALMMLFDVAVLPSRNPPEYDDLEALYRTDQQVSVQLPVSTDPAASVITVLAQPMFQGAQPSFGLFGTVNGTSAIWSCRFAHGIQRLALPIPPASLAGRPTLDVTLAVSGSPSRESDYLVIYASSKRGGPLIALEPLANVSANAADCLLA